MLTADCDGIRLTVAYAQPQVPVPAASLPDDARRPSSHEPILPERPSLDGWLPGGVLEASGGLGDVNSSGSSLKCGYMEGPCFCVPISPTNVNPSGRFGPMLPDYMAFPHNVPGDTNNSGSSLKCGFMEGRSFCA